MMEAIRVERKDNAIYFNLYSSSFRFPLLCWLVCTSQLYVAKDFSPFSFFLSPPLSFPPSSFIIFSLNPHLMRPLLASSTIKGPLFAIIIVVNLNASTLHGFVAIKS